ncbi:MAG: hypothetical protein JNL32_15820, partial [Candidatus Kapabacteria bacterium]|nr:hypothetical protein [Candidatus Kapabacteria bacterium]
INTRAFGESIADVIPHAVGFINGTQEMRIAACAKHFPGHGDTSVDSHIAMPVLDHNRERLTSVELVPFLAAVRAGVKSIMVAHLSVPSFDPSGVPASLSKPIISVLRERMAYKGVIVTDALDMHAITKTYSSGEAALRAISAGCDIALIPEDPFAALDALKEAERNGTLPSEQITASTERVRSLKEWCGLYERKANRHDPVSLEAHGMMALKAATNAVRIDGDESLLPLEQYNHVSCFALLQNDDIDPASSFFHYLAQVYEKNTDIAYMTSAITDDEIAEYKKGIEGTECCLFAVFARARSYSGSVQLDPRLLDAVTRIAYGKPSIAVFFGNPYLAETFPAAVNIKCYSDSAASRGAACLALSGKSLTL